MNAVDKPTLRVALVIGAGASLAQAEAIGKDPARFPPLDSTFFRTLAGMKIKVASELTEYAIDLLGYNPFLALDGSPRPGMEEFFKDVFYDFVSNVEDRRAQEAFRQLVGVYTTVLRRSTNEVAAAGARGPLLRLLDKAGRASSHLSLITFNHDLILENIVSDATPLRGRWCLRHGYGKFGEQVRYTLSREADGFDDRQSCRHPRPVRIHKLHGSLNWYFNLRDPDDDRAALRGELKEGQVIRVTRRRQIPQRLRHEGEPVRPVVVPPIYAKQAFLETPMKAIWQEAADDLSRADRVLFYGYSLPQTDIEAEKLFQRALARNDRLRWIDLVNPDPAAAERFARAFPSAPLRRYSSLPDFLASGTSRSGTGPARKPDSAASRV
ncbi:MAG: hypothetical protein ACRDLE_05395 [Gaiellaceae bacterium]